VNVDKSTDVMLADDETSVKNFLIDNLSEFNFLVPFTFSEIQQHPFVSSSLAVVDFGFLNNQGLEILRVLKTIRSNLPIIFTASRNKEHILLFAYKLGARDCFEKPYALHDISTSIKKILDSKKGGKKNRRNLLFDKYANLSLLGIKNNVDIYPNIKKVVRFIDSNYSKSISLSLLANIACMSKYHFCRTFKKQIGVQSSEYINKIRIRQAKQLLCSSHFSITQICYMTGFNDLTYFERVFKKLENCCPFAYRKRPHIHTSI